MVTGGKRLQLFGRSSQSIQRKSEVDLSRILPAAIRRGVIAADTQVNSAIDYRSLIFLMLVSLRSLVNS